MRWPNKLGLKFYCLIFSWIAMGQLFALTLPQIDAFVYYHTMIAFYRPSGIFYIAALAAAALTAVSLLPVILYAFNAPKKWTLFFKGLFLLRILGDCIGHNYEMQFYKATWQDNPLVAFSTAAITLLILFPSYQAHFRYAFK